MKRKEMIYPVIDEGREERIGVSSERLLYGEADYYFSPRFKLSTEILDGVIRGYVSKKNKISKFLPDHDLVICYDFSSKMADRIRNFIKNLKNRDNIIVTYQDVLGYYTNGKYMVILTSDCLYSDYGRDDFMGENDPKGYYVKCLLKHTIISKGNKIINGDDEIYTFERNFSDNFVSLFEELKELNKTIKTIPVIHPLNCEKRDVRENYLAILVDKTLADGNLSSNEVVRLEILSRQIGIDSMTLINLVKKSLDRYEKYKESREYIYESLEKMDNISKDYYYMLYHDLIIFELLSNKGNIIEQLSDFSDIYAKSYNIEEEFKNSFTEAMQKFVVSSYSLRDTIHKKGNIIESKEAFNNLFASIEYEYNLQKELLK